MTPHIFVFAWQLELQVNDRTEGLVLIDIYEDATATEDPKQTLVHCRCGGVQHDKFHHDADFGARIPATIRFHADSE